MKQASSTETVRLFRETSPLRSCQPRHFGHSLHYQVSRQPRTADTGGPARASAPPPPRTASVGTLVPAVANGGGGRVSSNQNLRLSRQRRRRLRHNAKTGRRWIQGFMVTTAGLFNGTGRSCQEVSLWRIIPIKLGMDFPSWGVRYKRREDLERGKDFPWGLFCCFAYGSIFQRMGCVLGRKRGAGKTVRILGKIFFSPKYALHNWNI